MTLFYNLNANIRFLRKKSGFTIPHLAKLLGVGKSTVDNIECGKNNTSLEVLDKLHTIFNISLDDLVYTDLSSSEE